LLHGFHQAFPLETSADPTQSSSANCQAAINFFRSLGFTCKTDTSRLSDDELNFDHFDSDGSDTDETSSADVLATLSWRTSQDSTTSEAYRSAKSVTFARAVNLRVVSPRPFEDSLTPPGSPALLLPCVNSAVDILQAIELEGMLRSF
jgi:hypothetical protein